MDIEMKTATGIEVGRSGVPVSRDAVRDRGLMAVGRRLMEQRAAGETRTLTDIEQRALGVAQAATEPAPEPAKEEPAPEPAPEQPAEEPRAANWQEENETERLRTAAARRG